MVCEVLQATGTRLIIKALSDQNSSILFTTAGNKAVYDDGLLK